MQLNCLEAKDMQLTTGVFSLAVIFIFGHLALATVRNADQTPDLTSRFGELSPEVRLMLSHLKRGKIKSEPTVTVIKESGSTPLADVGRIVKSAMRLAP